MWITRRSWLIGAGIGAAYLAFFEAPSYFFTRKSVLDNTKSEKTYSQVVAEINNLEARIPNEINSQLLEALIHREMGWRKDDERYEEERDTDHGGDDLTTNVLEDHSFGVGHFMGYDALDKMQKDIDSGNPKLPRLYRDGILPRELKRDRSKLLELQDEIIRSLKDPVIGRAYTSAFLHELHARYKSIALTLMAYNRGENAPRNARVQQQLNQLSVYAKLPIASKKLDIDGFMGPDSGTALKNFQRWYNQTHNARLKVDGILGTDNSETYNAIQQIWREYFTGDNPYAIVPDYSKGLQYTLDIMRNLAKQHSRKQL